MTDNIRRRLADLERRFKSSAPPTFEEFLELWDTLTPFDRACCEGDALREENSTLRGYLARLGVLDGTEATLQEIARGLDLGNDY